MPAYKMKTISLIHPLKTLTSAPQRLTKLANGQHSHSNAVFCHLSRTDVNHGIDVHDKDGPWGIWASGGRSPPLGMF